MELIEEPKALDDPLAETRPELLKQVDEYRHIARDLAHRIAAGRFPASGENGWPAKVWRLSVVIRTEETEPVRGWAAEAVWEELQHIYGLDPEADFDHAPASSFTDPLRRLRAQGHHLCPECRRLLPTAGEFEYWRRLDLMEAKRRDARKGAVSDG